MSTATQNQTKEIKSKFPGKCRACKVSIQPGDLVYWTPGEKGILCPECFDPDKQTQSSSNQKKQTKRDQRLELVDRIILKNGEIKKLYEEIDSMKTRLRDQMAIGEILETHFGKVSVTTYNRKVVKNEIVKAMLDQGAMSMNDFKSLFKQELKLTELGEKLYKEKDENLIKCLKLIENEKFNIFPISRPKQNENVVNFPEPESDDIPF